DGHGGPSGWMSQIAAPHPATNGSRSPSFRGFCEIVCCRLRCDGLTLKFGCPAVDNQFTAPDDFGIDNQLRPWDWFRACDNCPSFADVLIRSRERIPIVVIVLVL